MREYELEVLDQYDMELISTRKIRGAFFCDTDRGSLLLKPVTFSEKKVPLLMSLCEHLEQNGHFCVDTPMLTKEGTGLSTYPGGGRYLLKKWFSGRECDVKREADLLAAVRNLACLHREMYWKDKEHMPSNGRDLREEYRCHNRELKKVREFIRKKTSKGDFELLYLKCFEEMFSLAKQAYEDLLKSSYEELYQKSLEEKRLVHGDYNYHNILFLTDQIATTNFEHFHMDVQMADFYYFFRKVMEKHQWDPVLGMRLLQEYDRVRGLQKEELEYLAIRLRYPEKFWKIANSYYHSNKVWIPEKNMEKLRICIAQADAKNRFVKQICATGTKNAENCIKWGFPRKNP